MTITAFEPPAQPFAGENQSICGTESGLVVDSPAVGSGIWRIIAGGGIISDSTANSILITNLLPGINTFTWTVVNGPCLASDTVSILSIPGLTINAGSDTSFCDINETLEITGIIADSTSVIWTVLSGTGEFEQPSNSSVNIRGFSQGTNTYLAEAVQGACFASDTITVYVFHPDSIPCKYEEIFIPEGFSPDGDGVNDNFVIYGTQGRRVRLEVYNRWGTLVYESDNYLNDWNGISTGRWIIAGEYLPESTYYYIVQIEGEDDVRKGYLTLWR